MAYPTAKHLLAADPANSAEPAKPLFDEPLFDEPSAGGADGAAKNPFGEELFGEPLLKRLEGVGLRGLLPPFVPDSLEADDFEELAGPWREAGQQAAARIKTLYTETPVSIDSQRRLLAELRQSVAVLREGLHGSPVGTETPDQRNQRGFLAEQIDRRVTLFEAVLATLEPATMRSPRAAAAWAVADMREWLAGRDNGAGWLEHLRVTDLEKSLQPDADRANARDVVRDVRERLRPKDDTAPVVRDMLDTQPFPRVARALAAWAATLERPDRADSYQWLRETFARPTPDDNDAADARTGLIPAVEHWETARLDSRATAADARRILDALRQVERAGEGRELPVSRVVGELYLSANLHGTAAEGLFNRFAQQRRCEVGPICETVMGVEVRGTRVSDAISHLDLVPNDCAIDFQLRLSGVADSQTVGIKDPVKVYSTGKAYFAAVKPVTLDGGGFHPQPARVGADTASNPYDACSPVSRVPLLGPLVDNIVLQEAKRQKPKANAIARQKVVSRIAGELDRQTDTALADVERQFCEAILPRLTRYDLGPLVSHFRSTDTLALMSSRNGRPDEIGGGVAPVWLVEEHGLTMHVHESLLTAVLSRGNFAGRAMTEDEIVAELERLICDLTGLLVDLRQPDTETDSEDKEAARTDRFVFAEEDPVRVLVDRGEVRLILRTGFDLGERSIPQHLVSIPHRLELAGDRLVIRRLEARDIKVAPLEGGGGFGGLGQTIEIRRKIEKALPETRELDRLIVREIDCKPFSLRIERITAVNGWLSIWLTAPETTGPVATPATPQEQAPAPQVEPMT
jgi:hypothetical protein